jgi:uncharacterized membrane protein (UPF0127 family)
VLERGTVTIFQGNKRFTLVVEVAKTPATRARGLMYRKSLDENSGMLFVFDEASPVAFWMKNTFIPLSVAFVDHGGKIVNIQDMRVALDPEKGPFDFYQSGKPVLLALEVNQGFFARRGITVGARLTYQLRPRTGTAISTNYQNPSSSSVTHR